MTTSIKINITDRERALLAALRAIVAETMDLPAKSPISSDSYLPSELVDSAQAALAAYGAHVRAVICVGCQE